MKVPRDVSGAHLTAVLCRKWQYRKVHQVGSHIILETSEPTHHRIAIPDHHPLRLGTLSSILRAVARHKSVARDAIIADL
jgi:predicted RNA binding protein YcfA (HicA-like mRNA interferase family)